MWCKYVLSPCCCVLWHLQRITPWESLSALRVPSFDLHAMRTAPLTYEKMYWLSPSELYRSCFEILLITLQWSREFREEIAQSNLGTSVDWEYKSSFSWTYLCSGDFKRQAFVPFCAWVRLCFQRLAAWGSPVQRCASRHLNCTRNSI